MQISLTRDENILVQIVQSSGTNRLIVTPTPSTLESLGFSSSDKLNIKRTMRDFVLRISIPNIPETPFPEQLTSEFLTDFEINLLLRDNEWKSPNRLELHVDKKVSASSAWITTSRFSLVNRGTPFKPEITTLFTSNTDGVLTLGSDTQIAIKLVDAGGGFLSGSDSITLECQYHEEIEVIRAQAILGTPENLNWLVSSTPVQIFPQSANRAIFEVSNIGEFRVWLNFGSYTGANTGAFIDPGTKFTWENKKSSNPDLGWEGIGYFGGSVWAVADGSASSNSVGLTGYAIYFV